MKPRNLWAGAYVLDKGRVEVAPIAASAIRGLAAKVPAAMRARKKAAEAMREKLAIDASRELYQKRQGIVEPVFGQIKEARGFRRTMTWDSVSQPRINDLLRSRVSRFSLDFLVNIATALGCRERFELEAA